MVQQFKDLTLSGEDVGSIPGLAQRVKDRKSQMWLQSDVAIGVA